MREFSIGDRVEVIDKYNVPSIGSRGTVKCFCHNRIGVEMDKPHNSYHDCMSKTRGTTTKPQHGWWFEEESLKKIEEEVQMKFKVGDRVRITKSSPDYVEESDVGKLGTVMSSDNSDRPFKIKLDALTCDYEYCWCKADAIESAPEPTTERKLKVGDKVRITEGARGYHDTFIGEAGVIIQNDGSSVPYRVDMGEQDFIWCKRDMVEAVTEPVPEFTFMQKVWGKDGDDYIKGNFISTLPDGRHLVDYSEEDEYDTGSCYDFYVEDTLFAKDPTEIETKKMTVAEVCEALGYDVEIVK